MSIVSAVVLCTLVGAVGAIILVAASKFMAVEEDPRIEEVAGCLAGANCGGCGYQTCRDLDAAFAALLAIGISLPSVDYIALLLLIATSGKPPEVQVAALFTFLTVANSILLIPIITYLFAKERTIRTLENIRSWVLARSRRDYAILIALVGVLMVSVGLTHL